MGSQTSQRPRRLAALFVAATAVPTAGLVWLSVHLLEQDRQLAYQQLGDRLEGVVATVAADLRRDLDTLDLDALAIPEGADAVRVVLGRDGLIDRRGAPLPFVPRGRPPDEPDPEIWREGETAELAGRHAAARVLYRRLAASDNRAIRAGALVRLARVERLTSRPEVALDIYATLAALEGVPLFGDPADLVARLARLKTLGSLTQDAARREEAFRLRRDLAAGRWTIVRESFELAWQQSGEALGDPTADVPPTLALAEAVDQLWREWTAAGAPAGEWRGERTSWTASSSVTTVWRGRGDRLVALVTGPAFLADRWRAVWTPRGVVAALLDVEGRLVLGDPTAGPWATRLTADTGLPWILRVASRAPEDDLARLAARRRSLLLVLALASFVVLAGAYFVARGVRREVEVARLQSDFVSAVSHEFRTPLTSMSHLVELLRDRPLDEPRRLRYYEALEQETARLRRFVDGLLEFGRVDAGAARYVLRPADPAAFVTAVVERFRSEPAAGRHPVSLHVEPGLPPVAMDAPAVELALRNLLDNAAKYSPDDAPIHVRVGRDGGAIVVRVEDEGPGIPPGEQGAIFEKFVRGAGARQSNVAGTGIGLALAREIARAHRGDIAVASQSGHGSTFVLSLPGAGGSEPVT